MTDPRPQSPDTAPADAAVILGEMERAQIAEIIHDDVLQFFGAGLLAADTCEQAVRLGRHDLLPDQLATLRGGLEQGIARLRQLMADLRPYRAGPAGLEGALQPAFLAYQGRNGGGVDFRPHLATALGGTAEILAYRLILELLWAVRRTDVPMDIQITLDAADGQIALAARYRVRAEPPPAGEILSATRLPTLRWRVQTLGGSLTLPPAQPGAAALSIRLPLPPA